MCSPAQPDGVGSADAVVLPGREILVSDTKGEREALVLAAHEIGHILLHGAGGSQRVGDAGGWASDPGGLRLQGYSPRQAKEPQADLFADELLCPSTWLRERLRAGASPTEIAEEVGVPLDLALRQATRSLLRAPAQKTPRAVPRLEGLDEEQSACVAWSGGPLLVRGGPGTGKTTLLLARARLVIERGAPMGSVLVLASSRPAAEDAHVALSEACATGGGGRLSTGEVAVAGRAWIGTVTELALEIVSRWPNEIGLPDNFRLVDRTDALRLLEAAAALIGTELPKRRDRLRALRAIDDERHNRQAAVTIPARGGDRSTPTPLAKAYEQSLLSQAAIDVGGLVPGALRVLRSNIPVREAYRCRFQHVLVDDVQDLTPAEVCLLAGVHPVMGDVWATTDPGQAIDGFRGRSGDPTSAFLSCFAANEIRLRTNRRATALVLAPLASAFGQPVLTSRGKGGTLVVTGVADADGEVRAVVDRVGCLARGKSRHGDQVVLARRHSDLARVARALGLAGIPAIHVGDIAAREDVGDVLAFVRFSLEGEGKAFERVAASATYGVGPAAIRVVLSIARRFDGDVRAVLGNLGGLRAVSERERVVLGHLAMHASKLVEGGLSRGLGTWLFSPRGPLARRLAGAASPADQVALLCMHQFLKVCEEVEASGTVDYPSLRDRIDAIGSIDQHTHFSSVSVERSGLDAVRLMTIHAARGMDFETVHLAAFDTLTRIDGPRPPSPRHDDGNVFRVALSRVRDHLHLTVPASMAERGTTDIWRLMGARSTPLA